MDLRGAVALVTGAGAGIGEAVATRLAIEGAAVAVVDVDVRAANDTVEQIVAAGGRALSLVVDVTERRDVERMVMRTNEQFGRLDVVVNNAGGVEGEPFPHSPPDAWGRTLDVNLRAAMLVIGAAFPLLRARGGVVVNIASIAGLGFGPHDFPEYAAAKAGLIRLSSALAPLRDESVRVNCICPDWVDTPASRRTRAAMSDDELATVPDPMLQPGDIAEAVVLLVRDDTRAGCVMELPCGMLPRFLPADG
jgi:3-oxoacyl-[acyl-carrier protein] reductase